MKNKTVSPISAKEGKGIKKLQNIFLSSHMELMDSITMIIEFPDDDHAVSLVNWIYENTVVSYASAEDDIG